MAYALRARGSIPSRRWEAHAKANGVFENRPLVLGNITEDHDWSASSTPVQAALQFHILYKEVKAVEDSFSHFERVGVANLHDATLAKQLIATAASAGQLDLLLETFVRSEGVASMPVPVLWEDSVQEPSLYGPYMIVWRVYLKLRPQGAKTPEDFIFIPSVMDAPKLQRSAPRPDIPTSPAIRAPAFSSASQIWPPPLDVSPTDDGSPTTMVQILSEMRLHETETPSRASRLTANAPRKEHRSFRPEPLTTTPSHQPPPSPEIDPLEPLAPPSSSQGSRTPTQSAPPDTLRYLHPRRPARTGKTDYEVQTSLFVSVYLECLFGEDFTRQAAFVFGYLPQEKGYRYGTHPNGGHLFEAHPDGILLCDNEDEIKEMFMWVELKPFRRGTAAQRDCIRREEASQFVSILYQEWKQKREQKSKQEHDAARDNIWEGIKASASGSADPFVESAPAAGSAEGGVNNEKKYTKLMIAFDHDEFFIVLIEYSESYVSYITNMESVAWHNNTKESEFATFTEIGPYKLKSKTHMRKFNEDVLTLIVHRLQQSPTGRALIEELKRDLNAPQPPLSVDEEESLQQVLNSLRHTDLGRRKLRRMLSSSV